MTMIQTTAFSSSQTTFIPTSHDIASQETVGGISRFAFCAFTEIKGSPQVTDKRWRCTDLNDIHETIARCDGLVALVDRVVARTKLIPTLTSAINQEILHFRNQTDLNKMNKVRNQVCKITNTHVEALADSLTHRQATYEGIVQRSKRMTSDIQHLSALLSQRSQGDLDVSEKEASSFHDLLTQQDIAPALSLLHDLAKLQAEQQIAQQQFKALQQFEGRQQEIVGEFQASVFKSLQERFSKIDLNTLPEHDRNDLTNQTNRLLIEITKSAQVMHKQVHGELKAGIDASLTSEHVPSKRMALFEDDLCLDSQFAQDLEASKELSGEIAAFLESVKVEEAIECHLSADVGKALKTERSKQFDELKKRLPSTRSLPETVSRQVVLIRAWKDAISEIYLTTLNKLKQIGAMEDNRVTTGQEN